MSTLKQALKTSRDLAATAGLLLGAFGLPALMAGGVVIPTMVPPEAVEWMGSGGDDDPVVYLGVDDNKPSGSAAADKAGSKNGEAGGTAQAPKDGPQRSETSRSSASASSSSARSDLGVRKTGGGSGELRKATQVTSNRGVNVVGGSAEAHNARIAKLAAERRANSRGKKCAEPVDGIEHLYGERYVIRRDVIDRYATVDAALKMGRVAWNKDARGKTDGFRLTRVACGSPLAQVGLRRGDVIHSINGKKVRTLPQAFSAVRKVKRRDAIQVEMSRAGKRVTKMVTVQ